MADGAAKPMYYPLSGNPELIDLFKRNRANGESFEALKNGRAKPACDQLSPADLILLEEKSRPS